MSKNILGQSVKYKIFYILFGLIAVSLMAYYLSDGLYHFTSSRQFPINSFSRFPLSFIIFPAEVFSFLFSLYFIYNLVLDKPLHRRNGNKINGRVAILLPVYNEPEEIVERTIKACKKVRWEDGVSIYLLDDSADKISIARMQQLAKKYSLRLIRREDRIGYKAGNINNAVKKFVTEPFFVIFDSDQAPHPGFLEESMQYFIDEEVSFVQAPQHFIGGTTAGERAMKIGTDIFYRAQCVSKSKDGAVPFCGTNAVVKTKAFKEVGGFAYYTATEDIDLGIRMNSIGYRGEFVPVILVEGYAPPNFKAYKSQQYRWANGNLAILRENWLRILKGDFSLRYQIHMFFTLGWWLIGLVILAYIFVPIFSIISGAGTYHTWLPGWALFYLFFHVMFGISLIYFSLSGRVEGEKLRISDALLQYSLITNSAFIYARAAINALVFKRYIGFVTTNKARSNSGLWEIKWNLILAAICFGFSIYSLYNGLLGNNLLQMRTYLPVSLWLLFYALVLASSVLFVGKQEGGR